MLGKYCGISVLCLLVMACGGGGGPPVVPDVIADVAMDIPGDVMEVEGDASDVLQDQVSCPDGGCVTRIIQWEMITAGVVSLRSESFSIRMSAVIPGGISGVTTSPNGYKIVGGFEP